LPTPPTGRLWHASQQLRELPGGRLEARVCVAGTGAVRRWLQGFGAEVEVLEPQALRDAIRHETQRVVSSLGRERNRLRVPPGVRP
jgi:predicted DNA-binding transcriptional regulator YafY